MIKGQGGGVSVRALRVEKDAMLVQEWDTARATISLL